MGRTKDITDRAHARYMEERGHHIISQHCSFCDWTATGPFNQMLVLAKAHRAEQHPEARQRTKLVRNRGGIRTIGKRTLEENVALTRLQGGSGWASVEGVYEA